jgi:DNA polymerase I-like protein with 3'-5' exonuclease and polymerase domains
MLAEGDKAWLKLYDEDTKRIYGSVSTLGTRTRRCSHRDPNFGQVPRRGAYGKRCRELFGVPAGFKLVGCDAAGLELRLLAHYLHKYDGGRYAQEVLSGDVHSANQAAAGLPTRDNAKTFIYGFIYGAGNGKLGEIVGGSEKEGARLRKKFLTGLPAIKQLMDDTKLAWGGGNKWLTSIDGGPLFCPSAHAALNTLLQSAGAIVMKKAAVIFHERASCWTQYAHNIKAVGNIHDEIQIQVADVPCKMTEESMTAATKIITRSLPEVVGEMLSKSIAEAGRYYNLEIPMDGDYKIGDTWKETH